ncbi:lipid-A-disaccharide synthase [Brucella gallinifaecis]|uniref:Lipid-A-disaccharide synthase n=1 Tax=Brucella gallinifaecis TaxID=215590 RepID=A0A502BNK9_9HYPH|nr:lipid-A-disaccharide synthase [Brucella gallinifaecis]TPF75745.1 lipid-A-disaccharide synthase [Brucella gallinifaecis]
MNNINRPLKIAIVAGEESGDLLGADLIDALRRQTDRLVDLIGVGGDHLAARGLKTFFDPHEIALMGLGAILKNLPGLIFRIRQTAKQIVAEKPDCILLIDSPEFTHRVAKKIRAADPSIPIIKYIAPSVWAWRPQRAKAMRSYVDHVLTILPFEVEVMKRLNGPQSTYVGHRLSSYAPIVKVQEAQRSAEAQRWPDDKRCLLLLPGSRRGEIQALMEPFGKAVEELSKRFDKLEIILPTLPRVEEMVRELSKNWVVKPLIVTGDEAKWDAFARADAALAASGTVSLELALSHIPTVLSYKADWFARQFLISRITIWSAALPNIIADQPVVPEFFNESVRPGNLARYIEQLMQKSASRQAQINGFDKVTSIMATERPSGEIGAAVLLDLAENGRKH